MPPVIHRDRDGFERRWIAQRVAKVSAIDDRLIRGMPIVFNSLSLDLGGFREIITPAAVDRTFRDAIDVRALVDHDSAKIMGRRSAGTLTLRKEADGIIARIDPPDTSYAKDIVVSIERGDVDGMSFGFRVITDEWRLQDGEPVREVHDMEIREVSIVTFPAYEETDVSMAKRSLEAFLKATAWQPSADFLAREARAARR